VNYSYTDLIDAYSALGVGNGSTVYVVSALRGLGSYNVPIQTLDAHYNAIRELIGDDGTIIVPTASLNICNTKTPFDIDNTNSYQMGDFSEYIRIKGESVRSMHPFWSLTALGKCARELTTDVSKNAFAYNSVWSRMIDKKDIIMLHVGLHPSRALSIIHYAENLVGVPYRYTKEFIHPIIRGKDIVYEEYYMSVRYKNADISWDRDKDKIIGNAINNGLLREYKMPVGSIWASNITDMFNYFINRLSSDFYTFLKKPPIIRPYNI
jgi:aminoglycoside 3-N-acetyltransferase